MTMRWSTCVLVAGLMFSLWPTEAGAADAAAKEASYVHTVIVYFKNDVPPAAIDAVIADARELLTQIPSVRLLKVGRRAESSSRSADKDFQIGLVVFFENGQGLKEYLDHPKHKEFVERQSKHMAKVIVYDFEERGK